MNWWHGAPNIGPDYARDCEPLDEEELERREQDMIDAADFRLDVEKGK